ncbi:MAG: BON domain-containing protein [Planctomycetales bacterium]|nr:BON domain-containing protein [Planctomycetales bacterium]
MLNHQIPDKTLLKNVIQRMARKGISSARVKATVRNGDVTIAGTMDYEYERRSILNSVNSVPGIKRVVDQLRVEKKKRN